jgi:hypothetical protein
MPQRPTDKKEAGTVKSTERDKDGSKVTLSGLLNAIDGVASQVSDDLVAKLCLVQHVLGTMLTGQEGSILLAST